MSKTLRILRNKRKTAKKSIRKCANSQMRFRSVSQYFASFRKYDFAGFRKLSRKFANMVSQCFASFRKLSQFMVSQAFARIRKNSQMDFRKHSPRIRKCENHGFSQGFATGSLLSVTAGRWPPIITPGHIASPTAGSRIPCRPGPSASRRCRYTMTLSRESWCSLSHGVA